MPTKPYSDNVRQCDAWAVGQPRQRSAKALVVSLCQRGPPKHTRPHYASESRPIQECHTWQHAAYGNQHRMFTSERPPLTQQ